MILRDVVCIYNDLVYGNLYILSFRKLSIPVTSFQHRSSLDYIYSDTLVWETKSKINSEDSSRTVYHNPTMTTHCWLVQGHTLRIQCLRGKNLKNVYHIIISHYGLKKRSTSLTTLHAYHIIVYKAVNISYPLGTGHK